MWNTQTKQSNCGVVTKTKMLHPQKNLKSLATSSPNRDIGCEAMEAVDAAVTNLQGNAEDATHVFDSLAAQLSESISDKEMLSNVIEFIVQKCIRLRDFHLTGAQMCAYLSNHLTLNESIQTSFRGEFLKRCQIVFDARIDLSESYVRRKELINFTHFMAHLLLHMRLQDGALIQAFLMANTKLLLALLEAVTDESIECVDQVLRMIGSTLDENEQANAGLDVVFQSIRDLFLEKVLKREQQRVLLDLLLLRNFKWVPRNLSSETSETLPQQP